MASPRGNGWVRTPSPFLFRPLLGLAQIRWKVYFQTWGNPKYEYCNFYCTPAKKQGSDPPLFLRLATPMGSGSCYCGDVMNTIWSKNSRECICSTCVNGIRNFTFGKTPETRVLFLTCGIAHVNHMWNFTREKRCMQNFTSKPSHVKKRRMRNFTCEISYLKFHMCMMWYFDTWCDICRKNPIWKILHLT